MDSIIEYLQTPLDNGTLLAYFIGFQIASAFTGGNRG